MALIHLLLDRNRFTGTIPATLGLIKTLEVLRLDTNALAGSVPSNLNYLTNVNEFQPSLPSPSSTSPCSQPTFSFFNLTRQNDGQDAKTTVVIDKDATKALVAAARVDAERRDKEAVVRKKKAREALERFTSLVNKEKEKDSKSGGVVSAPESLNEKPKLEGPGPIQVAPKISEPEGSNGLKTSHADPMEEH